jgi:hypothetical protein
MDAKDLEAIDETLLDAINALETVPAGATARRVLTETIGELRDVRAACTHLYTRYLILTRHIREGADGNEDLEEVLIQDHIEGLIGNE